MNLDNISKLSDEQLNELYRNPSTVNEIKKKIIEEIEKRKINLFINNNEDLGLSANIKLLIILLSPLLIGSLILLWVFHYKFLKNSNHKSINNFGMQ